MKKYNYMLFDVAAAPLYLAIVGGPVILAAAVVVLIVVAVRLIRKANKKNQAASPGAGSPGASAGPGIQRTGPWDQDASIENLRKDDEPLER